MTKQNIINFEETFTKFYDKVSTVRKFDGSSNRGRLTLCDGDLLVVLSTGYYKIVKYELMPLLKLKSVRI